MAKLLPFRQSEPEVEQRPRLVNLDDADADDVFAALSSDTARAILDRLYEEPATASDVAEAADTSLQNARYHLDKLQDAGLVEAVDTWYSSRGTEMTVYAPTSEPLVVAAGREESASILREALKRLAGAVGVLALASVLVDRLVRTGMGPRQVTADVGDLEAERMAETTTAPEADTAAAMKGAGGTETEVAAEAATTTPTPTAAPTGTPMATGTPTHTPEAGGTDTPTPTPQEAAKVAEATPTPQPETETVIVERTVKVVETVRVTPARSGGVEALDALSPGLLFFAGGLVALVLATGWWYWRRSRRGY